MIVRAKKQELGVKTPELETQTSVDTGVWFPILFNIMSDSLYVSIGVAVRYNCQTARLWRLRVFPANAGFCGYQEATIGWGIPQVTNTDFIKTSWNSPLKCGKIYMRKNRAGRKAR